MGISWRHTVWAWWPPSLVLFEDLAYVIISYLQCSCGGERVAGGVNGVFFKPAVELVQIVCQLLILQNAGGWCLVIGDVFHTFPH